MSEEKGARFNTGKTRWDLLPAGALSELSNVFTYGLHKYAAHNYRKGLSWMDCFRAVLSHSFKWVVGEERDPESGCHHMAHAAWNCLVLVEMALCGKRYLSFDDRPKDVAPVQGTENIKEPPRKLSDEVKIQPKAETSVGDPAKPSAACPECSLVWSMPEGMSRHLESSHGTTLSKYPALRAEPVLRQTTKLQPGWCVNVRRCQ